MNSDLVLLFPLTGRQQNVYMVLLRDHEEHIRDNYSTSCDSEFDAFLAKKTQYKEIEQAISESKQLNEKLDARGEDMFEFSVYMVYSDNSIVKIWDWTNSFPDYNPSVFGESSEPRAPAA